MAPKRKLRKRSKSLRPKLRAKPKRAAPKRKLTASSKKTPTASLSEAKRSLHVVKNPFSKATQHPKMPDGKVAHSLSRRLRNVQSISCDLSPAEYTDIILCPHFGIGCVIKNSSRDQPVNSTVGWIGFPGQTGGFMTSLVGLGPYNLSIANDVAKQRIVSQAMRLTQINNDEANDGWYEACRLNLRDSGADYTLVNLNGLEGVAINNDFTCGLIPDLSVFSSLGFLPLVEQPSYVSGMLKDLKNKEFKLQPQGCECHMNETGDIAGIVANTDWATFTDDSGARLLSSEKAQTIVNQMTDRSWDYVLVRIHGRSTAPQTKLIVDLIQNVEFVFDAKSDFATFMTPNVADKQTDTVMDGMNNNSSAESGRIGT